ncbi:MAG: MFS transporter [Clostridia bacterium]|nr:MFS transporter [Clostridia bacterium]MBQ9920472.1 MFS transporter [Clostridia bacterium]
MKSKYSLTKKACYLGYAIQAVVNNLTSLLFIIFNSEPFSLSQEQLGRLIFFNFFSQLLIDALSIYIVPKLGYRRCVILAQSCSFLGFVFLGALPNLITPYIGLLISIIFLAMGSGFIEVLISPIAEALPTNNKAANMSFLHSFYCWGQAATVVITTLLLTLWGRDNWFYIPFVWAILPAINTVLFSFAPILVLEGDKNNTFKLRSILNDKRFYLFLILMFCAGGSEITMVQWTSFFVETGFSIDKWVGDILGPCMFAIFMGLGRVLYAVFGKKVKPNSVIMVFALICTITYLVVAFSNSVVICLIASAICGISVSVMWPGVFSSATETFKSSGASLFSVLALFGDLGCAVVPWLLGFISDYSVTNGFAEKFARFFNLSGSQSGIQLGFFIASAIPFIMFLVLFFTKAKAKTNR